MRIVLWSKIILTIILIFWSYVLVWSMNSYLKEIKDKYYPNGQLKYNYSELRMEGPVLSLSTLKETWYENGQLKSECRETPYGRDPKKHLKTWYKDGQLKSEYKDKNGVIIIDKCWDKNGNEKTSEPKKKITPKSKKVEKKKSNFGKQYYDLEETLLCENSSYNEEYGFIKSLREKLKTGEVYLEDMSSYIKSYHKKYDGGEIMTKTELYNQLEHIFTVYLEDWEKKKETTFVGFEDVEQYHSLSQKIVAELGDLLQEKIMELGKKYKI